MNWLANYPPTVGTFVELWLAGLIVVAAMTVQDIAAWWRRRRKRGRRNA